MTDLVATARADARTPIDVLLNENRVAVLVSEQTAVLVCGGTDALLAQTPSKGLRT